MPRIGNAPERGIDSAIFGFIFLTLRGVGK